MEIIRVRRRAVLAAGLPFLFGFLSAGCGLGTASDAPAPPPPDQEKRLNEMFKDYKKQGEERGRAEAAARRKGR